MDKSKKVVIQGGTIVKMAKEQIEEASGKKIVSNKNAAELRTEKKKINLEKQKRMNLISSFCVVIN